MIVFIDVEQNRITICGKEVLQYNLSDIDNIFNTIKGNEIYYVTSADVVSDLDVINLIEQITGAKRDTSGYSKASSKSQKTFLHPVKNRQIIILNENGDEYYLRGMFDFKNISNIPQSFMNSEMMQKYIQAGLIETVDEKRKNEILKAFNTTSAKRQKLQQEAESSILVNDSTPGSAARAAYDGIKSEDDIATEINISGDMSFKKEDHSEHHQNMKRLGL